jgi:site-specific DNA recombinase
MSETKKLRYVLYARKSSEDSEKQVESIDDQIHVMTKLAKAEKLNIVKTFAESRSAKAPGVRKEFYQMLEMIEKGHADAILCWEINRLSRNPKDSGEIQQLLEDEVIKEIRANDSKHLPTDSSFIFSVKSTMGNEFIRELRKTVKRGMAKKIRNGGLAGMAPEGYLNDRLEKTIEIDPLRYPLIRKAFDMFLTGNYTVMEVLNAMNNDWGYKMRARTGKKPLPERPMARSTLYKIFSNPRYAGIIPDPHDPEKEYKATYTKMISKEEFDKVQVLLGAHGRPRYASKQHFELKGFIKCGGCGCSITAERKTKKLKSGGINLHTYYHCTKKKPCQERGVTEKELFDQLEQLLDSYELSPKLYDWGMAALNEMAQAESEERNDVQRMHFVTIDKKQKALDNLLDLVADGVITAEDYKAKSESIKIELSILQKQQSATSERVKKWYEIIGNTLEELTNANDKFANGTFTERTNILLAIGQNPILVDKKLQITPNEWLLPLHKELPSIKAKLEQVRTAPDQIKKASEEALMSHWYTRQDSNLRPPVPQTDALSS